MALLDGAVLARRLSDLYSLEFFDDKEDFDGETFVVVRPRDLERPNGFGILVAKTPRQVEASFKADSFSRGLLRRMGEADREAREAFSLLASQAVAGGLRVVASINGLPVDDFNRLPEEEWHKIELDCDTRLPVGKITQEDLITHAFKAVSVCMGMILSLLPTEEVGDEVCGEDVGLPEGAKVTIVVNKFERNRINRAQCIAYHGAVCMACGFNFESFYGELGRQVIEVHHKIPVSQMGGSYRINPVNDLVPVCGNCHTMLHRRDPPLSVEELQELITFQMPSE